MYEHQARSIGAAFEGLGFKVSVEKNLYTPEHIESFILIVYEPGCRSEYVAVESGQVALEQAIRISDGFQMCIPLGDQ